MNKSILTQAQKKYIDENYQDMSRKKMAQYLGLNSASPVSNYMRRKNLSVSKEKSRMFAIRANSGRTSFTVSDDNFIRENYLKMPVKQMAKVLSTSENPRSYCGIVGRLKAMNLKIPPEIIKKNLKNSYFQKGQKAYNKGLKQKDYMSLESIEKTKATRFKPGNLPHNYNGGEHVSKDGYVMKSIGDGKSVPKHRFIWEKKFGKIPDGFVLKCKDGNKKNCDPDNWEMISMSENMNNNTIHRYPEELQQNIRLVSKLKKSLKE